VPSFIRQNFPPSVNMKHHVLAVGDTKDKASAIGVDPIRLPLAFRWLRSVAELHVEWALVFGHGDLRSQHVEFI